MTWTSAECAAWSRYAGEAHDVETANAIADRALALTEKSTGNRQGAEEHSLCSEHDRKSYNVALPVLSIVARIGYGKRWHHVGSSCNQASTSAKRPHRLSIAHLPSSHISIKQFTKQLAGYMPSLRRCSTEQHAEWSTPRLGLTSKQGQDRPHFCAETARGHFPARHAMLTQACMSLCPTRL